MQRVSVQHDFAAPIDRVFAHLAEHENLRPILRASIQRLRDGGDGHRNGVGSARRLKVGPLPAFEETVTEFVVDDRIRYRITKGSPLRDHEGTMLFAAHGTGSQLLWEIEFGAVVPGLDALVKAVLQRNIAAGLRKVDGVA